ncbi:type II toxin-antitoxin system RelE/ParE family toxin [Caulobacter sp. 602-2]|uniref:Type II toxin-antitoxin system RelE/ParE family toxin n=1 Tax=Caulobacter sp. 602-2 TaxID=2710887 RepID=A0A6G4QV88_9CAUL|nr:type II toxin-antitoxin system RelE/ParE family toxin [Caulobacter sp. 602-2]
MAAFPNLGRATRSGVRLHSVKPWIIVYRPVTGGVEVLRVLDGRRDLDVLIGKKT